VEAVSDEAAPGSVEDLLPAGVQVGLGDAGHVQNIKRMFDLDKPGPSSDSVAVK
jgi:hypothetical protein